MLRSPPVAGHCLEEPLDLNDASEDELLTESSQFNNLLRVLKPKSKKTATQNKKRQREEVRSDTEDEGDMFESSSLHEEDDDSEEGSSSSEQEVLWDVKTNSMQQSDEENSEDDLDLDNKSEKISSFNSHLGHKLTSEITEKISREQSKFRWEMPAVDFPMSKWVGSGEPILQERTEDLASCLKQKLYTHWLEINKASESNNSNSCMQNFFSLCSTYRDIMHCNKKPFYLKGNKEDSSIMDAYILHALNHIYRTRDLVLKNDAKLAKNQESKLEELICGDTFIDQGFTRPKVLFLLPLASIAFRVVKRLVELTPLHSKANVEHFKRFSEEFGAEAIDEEDEESGNSKSRKRAKPADYQALFGGNNNDHFMLGIKFTKRNVKLYSDFYSSDIIVASPLGLVTKIGEAEVEKEKDVDYLSSIEVLIIDHADIIAMQNWSHAKTVVEQLNRTPSKQHGTDVMRIRQWYLEGHSRYYRQTIMLSSFVNPEMNALFNRLCMNYEGKIKLVSQHKGVLPKILLQVRQVYERFDATSVDDADDARLEYFCQKIFPKIKANIEGGTMLFISSYFEFVRIRNFLKSQDASFCLLGEYTKPSDISRARIWFFEGKRKIMLYTERAHFYHRYKIRGIQNLIMYSLPEKKEFYPEILNMLDESKVMTCNVLFSRFDQLKLEGIVGTASAKRMLSSDKSIFAFC